MHRAYTVSSSSSTWCAFFCCRTADDQQPSVHTQVLFKISQEREENNRNLLERCRPPVGVNRQQALVFFSSSFVTIEPWPRVRRRRIANDVETSRAKTKKQKCARQKKKKQLSNCRTPQPPLETCFAVARSNGIHGQVYLFSQENLAPHAKQKVLWLVRRQIYWYLLRPSLSNEDVFNPCYFILN